MSREFIEEFEPSVSPSPSPSIAYEEYFQECLNKNSRKLIGSPKWWRYIESKQSRGVKGKKSNYYGIEEEVNITFI